MSEHWTHPEDEEPRRMTALEALVALVDAIRDWWRAR